MNYSHTKNTTQTIKINELEPQHNNVHGSQKHNVELGKLRFKIVRTVWFHLQKVPKQAKEKHILRDSYFIDKTMNKSKEMITIRGKWLPGEETGKDCDWEDECRGLLGPGDVLFLYLLVATLEFHFSLHVLYFTIKMFLIAKKKKIIAH